MLSISLYNTLFQKFSNFKVGVKQFLHYTSINAIAHEQIRYKHFYFTFKNYFIINLSKNST